MQQHCDTDVTFHIPESIRYSNPLHQFEGYLRKVRYQKEENSTGQIVIIEECNIIEEEEENKAFLEIPVKETTRRIQVSRHDDDYLPLALVPSCLEEALNSFILREFKEYMETWIDYSHKWRSLKECYMMINYHPLNVECFNRNLMASTSLRHDLVIIHNHMDIIAKYLYKLAYNLTDPNYGGCGETFNNWLLGYCAPFIKDRDCLANFIRNQIRVHHLCEITPRPLHRDFYARSFTYEKANLEFMMVTETLGEEEKLEEENEEEGKNKENEESDDMNDLQCSEKFEASAQSAISHHHHHHNSNGSSLFRVRALSADF